MAIAWTDDLATGIDVIDHQHMRIVDNINQMEEAMGRQDRHLIGHLLDELIDYTLSHFAFEESLQLEAGYKYARPHKAIHDAFAKRVARYQERHNAGEDVSHQVYEMLCTWLVHHIKRDDMAYVAEVRSGMNLLVRDKQEGGWFSRALAKFFK
jgi:hemerythrin